MLTFQRPTSEYQAFNTWAFLGEHFKFKPYASLCVFYLFQCQQLCIMVVPASGRYWGRAAAAKPPALAGSKVVATVGIPNPLSDIWVCGK